MSNEKEIQQLHDKGFVILKASITKNNPIGWKVPGSKNKWGYIEEMKDQVLTRYRSTFNARSLSLSHCGFYLGHGNLCCIDLDTKKVSDDRAEKMVQKMVKALGSTIVVERTKSNGYHIYFLYAKRLDNIPNFTGLDAKEANWIELYYQKRFIACYLSNSKKYKLEHGDLSKLKPLTDKQHKTLLSAMESFKSKFSRRKKNYAKELLIDESTYKKAELYAQQIEEKGLDITGDNPLWFKIGKALASAFGTAGFSIFNRISQFSPTFNADTIEETFNRFVEGESTSRDKKVTIASFFKICEDAGLLDESTLQTLRLNPPSEVKEFELLLDKKQRMAEQTHIVVTVFLQNVHICCLDKTTFYVYDITHWQKRTDKDVLDLLFDFINRSEVKENFRVLLRTVPYYELMLRELRAITERAALLPHTGNLVDGIFINMMNGVLHVNMKNGKRKLLDHEPWYNFTTMLPFCYDPLLTSPKFDKWLNTQIPDKELHTAYFAFVASCLTRHKADIIMLLTGGTSTGKSSLIDITRHLIGLENSASISAGTLFSNKSDSQTQAMQMENKLLAYDFDSQPFTHLEMLLKVAAQEPIMGWEMHIARRPVINYGRLLIAMNKYSYNVFNQAVARRILTINMDVAIVKDNNIMPPILDEVAGIFNHILNVGIKHLLDNGGQIKITDAMRAATLEHHMGEKDAMRWYATKYVKLKEASTKSNKLSAIGKLQAANKGVRIEQTQISDMYESFRIWSELTEGIPVNRIQLRKHFAKDLEYYGIKETVYKDEGKVKRCVFVGV